MLQTKQFLFTKQPVKFDSDAGVIPFGSYNFFYNKKITISNIESPKIQIVVIGNLFDYKNPLWSNNQIIESWVKKYELFNDILNSTFKYSGEYLVFYRHKQTGENMVFTDTAAQYELYFSWSPKGDLVAASNHQLIEKIVPLKKDTALEAVKFYSSKAYQNRLSFVGEDTQYLNLKRLKPNHYLNLNTGKTIRYFPSRPITKTFLTEASLKVSKMLKGYIASAANRYKLLIPVTAGWDSRLLLAASKDFTKKSVYYVVYDKNRHHKFDRDVPEKIFKLLKIPFVVIEKAYINNNDHKGYQKIHKNIDNQGTANYKTLNDFYKEYKNHLNINGNVSEIARLEFDEVYFLSPKKISFIEKYPNLDYALKRYTEWFEKNKILFKKNGYRTLDMLYWEENCANWVVNLKRKQRLNGYEIFSPFNSREMLLTLYGLPKKYRRKQNTVVYKEIIKYLWPELINVPINPGLKSKLMQVTQYVGIFQIFRNLKLWFNMLKMYINIKI
jgi:hypothetical protein